MPGSGLIYSSTGAVVDETALLVQIAASLDALDAAVPESGRTPVNLIAGQAGIDANTGAPSAKTPRVTQADRTDAHTGTTATVADAAVSTTILAANTLRTGAAIRNDSTARLYLHQGATATTASVDFLDQGDIYDLPILANGEVYRGIITGIWASDAGGSCYVRENVIA